MNHKTHEILRVLKTIWDSFTSTEACIYFPCMAYNALFFVIFFQKFIEHSLFRSLGESEQQMECSQEHENDMISESWNIETAGLSQ